MRKMGGLKFSGKSLNFLEDLIVQFIIQQLNLMAELMCLSQIMTQLPNIINRSGRGIFQYGQYHDCLESPHFKYNLVSLGVGQVNTGLVMGMCLPDKCTQVIIKKSLSKALEMVKIPFNIYSVTDNIQDYQFPMSPLFFFTVFLIIVLFLLVIISSFSYKKEQEGKNLLSSFAIQNSLKVFQRKKDSDLNIFNGIRAISMIWVIIGHCYLLGTSTPINFFNLEQISSKPFFLLIQGGFLSVDIFFFLGGFFLAFVFLREKSKTYWKYPMAILQRILRIWPAFIITMLIYYTIFMHLGSGPRWPQMEPSPLMCKNMWRSMLFIDNFINDGTEMCLGWGWYLQVDFQIFLVCLIVLFLYGYNKKIGGITGILLTISSLTYNIIFTQQHNQKIFTDLASLQAMANYFMYVYIKPYARWIPYILGLFLGVAYTEYSQLSKNASAQTFLSVKMKKIKDIFQRKRYFRILFQWMGIGIMVTLLILPRDLQVGHQWGQIWHSLYLCFSRLIICICILMFTLPTLLGIKNSFFRTVLDTTLFNILAKISFCTYLIHYMIITQTVASQTYDIYYNLLDVFTQFHANLFLSCFFGFLMTIIVEVPFSVIQKHLFTSLLKNTKRDKSSAKNIEDQQLVKPINSSEFKINDSIVEQQK